MPITHVNAKGQTYYRRSHVLNGLVSMAPFAHTASTGNPTEHLAGSVERLAFHNEETGFCVLRVKVRGHRDLVTIVGTAAAITTGEYVEGEGWWVTDRTHGLQFKMQHLRVVPPSTLEGIEKYLGSGMVKGIGPHFAKKLVGAFGEQVFDVIEQTERLVVSRGTLPVNISQNSTNSDKTPGCRIAAPFLLLRVVKYCSYLTC